MRHPLRPLDRYVLREFLKVLTATALGFPALVIVIDLTEKLAQYISRQLPIGDVALAYLYGIPDTMFLVLPASVLFATVFTIGAFTRHSELTAAKASGISFHRFILPIALGATGATGLGLALAEIVPPLNARPIERLGVGPDYPTYVIAAREGSWTDSAGWTLKNGVMHLMPDTLSNVTVRFDSLRDPRFVEAPTSLMANPKAPAEMGYRDLGRFIRAMERSGTDVNKLRVERMLKIAIPVTCVIIMLFGAPLATSTQRGGTAYGIGISLATTVLFLVLLQLTQAIGAGGLIKPELAAWLPGAIFTAVGTFLLIRVRT
jgi:lipopolysaccharide export system permease protein